MVIISRLAAYESTDFLTRMSTHTEVLLPFTGDLRKSFYTGMTYEEGVYFTDQREDSIIRVMLIPLPGY